MFMKITKYSMLIISYLIHHNHYYYQKSSVQSFQHVISHRTIPRLRPFVTTAATTTTHPPRRSVICGRQERPYHHHIATAVFRRHFSPRNHHRPFDSLLLLRRSLSSTSTATSTLIDESITTVTDDDDESTMAPPSYPTFQSITELHPVLKRNLQELQLVTMTEIQSKTWEAASAGQDVLGRARTGTGKTFAFLLPAIQQLLLHPPPPSSNRHDIHNNMVQMLVLSPTRELAAQIHEGGVKLTKGCSSQKISHQCMFGGSSKPNDLRMIERQVPTILVSTPGRLLDHLQNTVLRDQTSFAALLSQVQILVLDETDRLLDMGFKRDVESIISYLPKKEHRQTLLFSATVPNEVKEVIRHTMRPNYVTVDCIHDTDPASHTNAQVSQTHVIVSAHDRWVSGTVDILRKLIADTKRDHEPLKLVVFFNTAHLVGYYAALFSTMSSITAGLPVYELHSRKSQTYRTRTAAAFRDAPEAILFTSDVSARGVDYPGVTDVVQFGIPDSRESYIHRLGRTGRAGKQGEGMIVLSDMEVGFLKQLTGLDIPVNQPYQELVNNPPSTPPFDRILNEVANGGQEDLAASAASAYRSVLGFYNGKLNKLGHPGTEALIDFANTFSKQTGLTTLPEIEMQTVRKMGLKDHSGLNVVRVSSTRSDGGRGESGRGRVGGGRGRGGGGPGRGSGRGSGGGRPRYMSTDTQASSLPMKRSTASGDANRDQQSRVAVHSPKKPKNESVSTNDTANTTSKKNHRRRPGGRGGRAPSNV